ncbi:alpha-methylacyl-CoA racemase [Cercophora newfieldiana]|uniref:Alpha-methylacyl-CoA racemase n=1 Tax=Cercophora newfieldiana TaxID=92897 RepID=A0AA39YIT6_9PEZI|nr:alpha-methylacyl-CoA racemase [Cercophora newfieldiana]
MPSPPPLTGLRVLEFAGLAPSPFAGLLLADAGASVLRIDRATPGSAPPLPTPDLLTRHKASLAIDLKSPSGIALIRALIPHVDILIDPFRPGVMEKLHLGPTELMRLNPRLIYGRLTGFRRDGKYAAMAGHDINYLAVSGALSLLGRAGENPHPPVNLLADFAGGGAMLVLGILMALVARGRSGRGQVVEGNMVDGASYLATFVRFAQGTATGNRPRGGNLLDGGCPFYDTYETADGGYMAVGALEPHFYRELLRGLGLEGGRWDGMGQAERSGWGEMRRVFAERFKSKTRGEWEAVFDGTDACCTPVFGYGEMRGDKAKEGDQRPAVTLRETPMLAVRKDAKEVSHGQGPGVEGEGYAGRPLVPGNGGVKLLEEWLGWKEGREFTVQNGGASLKEVSRL